ARIAWGAAIPATLLLGAWMTLEKTPEVLAHRHWYQYLRLTMSPDRPTTDEFNSGAARIRQTIETAIAAADTNPRLHRAQVHAGQSCVRKFMLQQIESGATMPLSQIREAALALVSMPVDQPELQQALVNAGTDEERARVQAEIQRVQLA